MSLLLAWALSGPAGASGVRLEWSAPAGCPGEAQVQADVDRLLAGRPIPGEIAATALVQTEAGGGLTATLRIAGSTPRTLQAGECGALARAVALVIAVAVDPLTVAAFLDAAEAPTEPPPPTAPPAVVVTGPDPAPALEDAPSPGAAPEDVPIEAAVDDRPVPAPGADADPLAPPPRRPAPSHGLGLRGGVVHGVSSELAGAIALGYVFDRGPLRIEGRALYATPRRLDYPDGVGARLQAVTLGALACAVPELRRIRAPICAGVEAGPLIGAGQGVTAPQRRVTLWASALAGVSLVARIHPRIALTVGGELGIALRRPAFHVGDREILSRAPAVGGRGLLGLEIRLR